ncbi:MAG: RluA family pseudouridine synthase [Marinilabiliaceae bacterium]|jgi:23S rRNA pseudouridine1911/1915/1917 synthase|nr:RluA family pseudouridine synthase [Marinilabiliaceae bacterium]
MLVLYEDNHLIAVYKNNNELVQGDSTGDTTLADEVKKYIKKVYKKPGDVYLGITHRIDRPVSGVVLFAKTSKALTRLNNMLRDGEIHKKYLAVVKERPPEDEAELVHFLKKNEKQNKSYSYDTEVKGSKKARLRYRILSRTDSYYLLDIDLYTGRHHQIRSQLAKIGCPIRGDLKYGYPRSNKDGGISLHARSIEFIHPVKKEQVKITAPLPELDIWPLFRDLI